MLGMIKYFLLNKLYYKIHYPLCKCDTRTFEITYAGMDELIKASSSFRNVLMVFWGWMWGYLISGL